MRHIISWNAGLVAVVLITAFYVLPASRVIHSDFLAYYLTGRMVTQGETPSRIYEYPWFQRQSVYAGIDDVPTGTGYNPPSASLSLLPLGWLEPKLASLAWLGINVTTAIALLAVLARATGLPIVAGLVLLLVSTFAFRNNLVFGQIYLVLTFLVASALALRDAGRRVLAGALLGAVTALKLFTAPLLLYFLWRREWKTVTGFLTGLALVIAASLLLLGWETNAYWLTEVFSKAQSGFGDNPAINLQTWNNLLQMLFYYNETWNPDPPIRSTFAFWMIRDIGVLSLLACTFFAARTRDNALALSVIVLALPIISPSTRTYHMIICVVPLAYWGMYLVQQGRWRLAITATCLYVFAASRFAYFYPDLFLRFGALLILETLLLRELRPWRLPTWVLPSIVVFGLIHAAIESQPREQDTAVRVTPDASLVDSPTYRAGALAYSAMTCKNCTNYRLRGDVPQDLRFAGHVFGTRFSHDSGSLFFELAEHRHSEILEWRNGTLIQWSPPNMNCVNPSPSRDGQKMVAVCNGVLHLFSAPGQSRVLLSVEGEISDPDLSPDGSLVAFAWRRNERWSIYQVDLTGRDPVPLTKSRHSDRWPRYSPNGAWVAFSRQNPSADIWVIERKTGRELRITQHPDNDTEPAWSDDGKALYFVSDRNLDIFQGSVYRIDLPTDITESDQQERGTGSRSPQP